MEDKLLQTILTNTFTKADLYQRLALLRRRLETRFFERRDERKSMDKMSARLGPDEGRLSAETEAAEMAAMKDWGDEFYGSFNRNNAYRLLEKIHQLIEKLPLLTLYLPVELPVEEVPKLGSWLRDNVNRRIIMDIRLNPSLVGGLALVWQGVYRDFSLRFYLEKNKERIMEVISGYEGG